MWINRLIVLNSLKCGIKTQTGKHKQFYRYQKPKPGTLTDCWYQSVRYTQQLIIHVDRTYYPWTNDNDFAGISSTLWNFSTGTKNTVMRLSISPVSWWEPDARFKIILYLLFSVASCAYCFLPGASGLWKADGESLLCKVKMSGPNFDLWIKKRWETKRNRLTIQASS